MNEKTFRTQNEALRFVRRTDGIKGEVTIGYYPMLNRYYARWDA